MTPGEYLGTLLHAVTHAHILHLQAKSYAKHMALGDLYDGLQDAADELAECYQGLHGIVSDYSCDDGVMTDDPVGFAQNLGMFIEENRESMGKDSAIQNLVDGVQAVVLRAIYKLENLA